MVCITVSCQYFNFDGYYCVLSALYTSIFTQGKLSPQKNSQMDKTSQNNVVLCPRINHVTGKRYLQSTTDQRAGTYNLFTDLLSINRLKPSHRPFPTLVSDAAVLVLFVITLLLHFICSSCGYRTVTLVTSPRTALLIPTRYCVLSVQQLLAAHIESLLKNRKFQSIN